MDEQPPFIIETKEHWRALWHPLRIGILTHLSDRKLTNEELAKALGVKSGKLYHHTKLLLKAGLILEAGTRQKGPITERLYQSAASSLATSAGLSGLDQVEASLRSALTLFRSTREHDPSLQAFGQHLILEMGPDQMRELQRQVQELAMRAKSESDPSEKFAVSVAFLCHPLTTLPNNP